MKFIIILLLLGPLLYCCQKILHDKVKIFEENVSLKFFKILFGIIVAVIVLVVIL